MPAPLLLAPNLYIHRGPVHTGILLDGRGHALLIDPGDPALAATCRDLDATPTLLLATHHHPDQVAAVADLRGPGTRLLVPAGEKALFEGVAAHWADPRQRWHVYHMRPQPWVLAHPLRVDGVCRDGEAIGWGEATVRVLDTPGHTDGAVTYVVETGGRRVAFTGDCIAGPGRIWDAYSLQKGTQTRDYHGFMGDRGRLGDSLRRIAAAAPDALVPSHGEIMETPGDLAAMTIAATMANVSACYANYASIAALRYYFPQVFAADAAPGLPPGPPAEPLPPCARHLGTTFVLIGEAGAALVLDCGHASVVERLRAWLSDGTITAVEGLWISHYHDDHVDAVAAFRSAFPACPVLADADLADVLERPEAYRLPCQCPEPVQVDRRLADGERWQWHEFALTAYRFPGQTLHHGALLAEGRGQRLFFIGDAFTPTGLDDYCAFNRHLLGPGLGYRACLDRVAELNPVLLFNCHVEVGFRFDAHQIAFMQQVLAEREELFGRLFPWPHANFGLDPDWARCFPYEQSAPAGGRVAVEVRITNHAAQAAEARASLALPADWAAAPAEATTTIAAGAAGALRFEVSVPETAGPGRHVLDAWLHYGGCDLGRFRQAVVAVYSGDAAGGRRAPADPPA